MTRWPRFGLCCAALATLPIPAHSDPTAANTSQSTTAGNTGKATRSYWLTPAAGTREIGVSGTFGSEGSNIRSGNPTANRYVVNLLYGQFLSKNFEIAGTLGSSGAYPVFGQTRANSYGIEPKLYLPTSTPLLPFIGAIYQRITDLSPNSPADTTDTLEVLVLGADYFLTPNVAVTGTFEDGHQTFLGQGEEIKDVLLGFSSFLNKGPGKRSTAAPFEIGVSKGTQEIGLSDDFETATSGISLIEGTYGYFVNPSVELAGTLESATFLGETSAGWTASPTYNVRISHYLVPFAGFLVGGDKGEGFYSADTGERFGVRYFVNENVALTATYQYTHDYNSNGFSSSRYDSGNILLGVSTFLQPRHRHLPAQPSGTT